MRCPFCGWEDSKVVDSRDVDGAVRRRRECLNPECAGRFTTYERLQAVALFVVKKDGRREEFSRQKLLGGLRRACEKRPLAAGAVETLAAEIESTLYAGGAAEVPSSGVGELVMQRLRELDAIAYVRFASVYREFRDIDALRDLLDALSTGAQPGGAQLPLLAAEFASDPQRLPPAAPITTRTTRTRRPVRPAQYPVAIDPGGDGGEVKRRRKA